jgi:hypothetical protein
MLFSYSQVHFPYFPFHLFMLILRKIPDLVKLSLHLGVGLRCRLIVLCSGPMGERGIGAVRILVLNISGDTKIQEINETL